ncbi:40304_t:CDS:2, partial [Gigaspora margarita]
DIDTMVENKEISNDGSQSAILFRIWRILILSRQLGEWCTYSLSYSLREACKIMGGITFFFFASNVTLSGALSLTTYLRICREIVIDLGTYDYKLFLPIILTSLMLTLIGDKNYGQMEVYNALNRFGAKFGQVDFIVARRITFYILIVILEWYESLWIYLAATLSVSFGGIGNTILYIIYEKWRNRYSPTASENARRSSGIEMTRSVVITSTSCTNENC